MTKARTRLGGLLAVICVLGLVLSPTGALAAEASMTIEVECHSVEASSSKDISNVKVYFVDGTSQEINVNNPSFSQTFDKEIDHATAKSGQTQVSDSAGSCNRQPPSDPKDDKGGDDKDDKNGDKGDKDDNDDVDGRRDKDNDDDGDDKDRTAPSPTTGSASMTIEVDCFSIRVTSSKDISNVKVTFVDGTKLEINVNSPSFSRTFDKPIDWASAKSATTTVVDAAPENCVQVSGSRCPHNSSLPMGHKDCVPPPPVCPHNSGMPLGHPDCKPIVSPTFELCPADTDHAGFPMTDLKDCDKGDVQGRIDTVNPLKFCPSGPFKGMPMKSPRDCDAVAGAGDSVLPRVIVNSADAVKGAARRAAGAVGGVLPFTGAGDAQLLVGAALALIGSGALALRVRRND